MPNELNAEKLEKEAYLALSPWQRRWVARLLHDHVSNPVTALAMQIEIIYKMIARDMDIAEELESLKENITNISARIVDVEHAIRPPEELQG